MTTSLKFKETIENLPIYRGGNSAELIRQQYGFEGDIVKLSSNENPLPVSANVVAALQNLLDNLNRYPPGGDIDLRTALAAYIGRGLTADHFVTGNGGCDVLRIIADSFLTAGDEAIICTPTFPVYELTIKRMGATVVTVPLSAPDFSYDVAAILDAVTEKTRLLYLCSPNNPTGSILTQQQIDALMANLPDDVLVVADEVYFHFVTDPDYANSLPYVQNGRNLIIVHSFSKVFGLAGLRLGYAIAPAEIAQYLSRARLPFHINNLTMVGGKAGLQDRDHMEETISLVVNGRDQLYAAMQPLPGIAVWPTQANFLLFKPDGDSKKIADELQQRGTIVRELSGFYMPGYLRVSVGRPEDNVRFVQDLTAVLAANR